MGPQAAAPESSAIFLNLELEEMPFLAILHYISLYASIQYPS